MLVEENKRDIHSLLYKNIKNSGLSKNLVHWSQVHEEFCQIIKSMQSNSPVQPRRKSVSVCVCGCYVAKFLARRRPLDPSSTWSVAVTWPATVVSPSPQKHNTDLKAYFRTLGLSRFTNCRVLHFFELILSWLKWFVAHFRVLYFLKQLQGILLQIYNIDYARVHFLIHIWLRFAEQE